MFAHESQARAAYVSASRKLEAAQAEYAQARTALHKITGEFSSADQKLSLQPSTTSGPATAGDVTLTNF